MVDWETIAKASYHRALGRQEGKGRAKKSAISIGGYSVELVKAPDGKTYISCLGREMEADKRLVEMWRARDPRLLEELRKRARPHRGHWYLDLSTPFPKAVEVLREKRRKEGGLRLENLFSAARSWDEVERWKWLVFLVGDKKERKRAEELYNSLVVLREYFEKLKSEGAGLSQALREADRVKASYPEPIQRIIKYLVKEMFDGPSKYDLYQKEWTLKVSGVEMYSRGDKIVRVIAGNREVTLLPVEGSLASEGRRVVELDFDPRVVSWFLYRHPGAVGELLQALEEGKIPEYAKVLVPWLGEEERKGVLERMVREGNLTKVLHAVVNHKDVEEILRLGRDILGNREEKRLQRLRDLLKEAEEAVRPYKNAGGKITPGFAIKLLKARHGKLPGDVEHMLRITLRNVVYPRDWGRVEEEEKEGWWEEELRWD